MRNIGDSLRKLADQLVTEAGGTPDRPTSLYSAGTVGGPTPRRPASGEARDSLEQDVPPPRSRDVTVESTAVDIEQRRSRPVAQQRYLPRRRAPIRAMLRSPQSLRTAIVVSEVLGPPVALREERR